MKIINFRKVYTTGGIPFWKPWGVMGCLGRILQFLLLLIALILLLSLFRRCSEWNGRPDDIDSPRDTIVDPMVPPSDWNQPIADAEEVGLPSPEQNQMPPFEQMTPIPNPEDGGITEIYPNNLFVIFDSDSGDNVIETFSKEFKALYPDSNHVIVRYQKEAKTLILEVPATEREEICMHLPEQIPMLDFFIAPIEMLDQSNAPSPGDSASSDVDKLWYFAPIQANEAQRITQGSPEVIVGIVDSYMDLSHPDLKGNRCLYPYSVARGNRNVAPPSSGVTETDAGHGTMVTAIAVGNINNRMGSAGIAPKCKFIPVSLGNHITTVHAAEGVLYCIYHGASVINLSFGAVFPDAITHAPLNVQIEYALKNGKQKEQMWNYIFRLAEKHHAVIVWASGNENAYTAMDASRRNANTIRVSAVDRNLRKASFSNYGNYDNRMLYESTISAPGVDIYAALPNNSYDAWDGTSFSAPIITGVVALMKSVNPNLTTHQIITILQNTGKPVEGAPTIGKLVQVKDALLKAKEATEE